VNGVLLGLTTSIDCERRYVWAELHQLGRFVFRFDHGRSSRAAHRLANLEGQGREVRREIGGGRELAVDGGEGHSSPHRKKQRRRENLLPMARRLDCSTPVRKNSRHRIQVGVGERRGTR